MVRGFKTMQKISQAEFDSLLRKNTTKLRGAIREMMQLFRMKYGGDIPGDTLDTVEEAIMQQLESGISQMKLSLQEGL